MFCVALQYVGEFGRGQTLFVAITSLNYIPNAVREVTLKQWHPCSIAKQCCCAAPWQHPAHGVMKQLCSLRVQY
jgi:hypothetical protein